MPIRLWPRSPNRDYSSQMRVQSFDISPLVAIYDAVSHFAGHTQQIVYITRLRLGDKYTFQWTPTKEQGG